MEFHSYFSDDSAQNAATTFEHMKKFIHWIYDNNFSIKYDIIYDTTNGCSKQYRCANATWRLYVFVFTYRVVIDTRINATGYVRRKIDDINRADNTYSKQKMCIIGTG